jgi:hypothetical protein
MGVMCPYHYEPPNRFESKITKHHVLSSPCSRPLNYQASSLEISRGLVEWLRNLCSQITFGLSTWDSDHMEWQMSVIRKAPDEYLKYYLSNLEKMT